MRINHLTPEDIKIVLEAVLDAGLGRSREYLLLGVNKMIVAGIPTEKNATDSERLLQDIYTLNDAAVTDDVAARDGGFPVERWIQNAIILARERTQEATLKAVLARRFPPRILTKPVPSKDNNANHERGTGPTVSPPEPEDKLPQSTGHDRTKPPAKLNRRNLAIVVLAGSCVSLLATLAIGYQEYGKTDKRAVACGDELAQLQRRNSELDAALENARTAAESTRTALDKATKRADEYTRRVNECCPAACKLRIKDVTGLKGEPPPLAFKLQWPDGATTFLPGPEPVEVTEFKGATYVLARCDSRATVSVLRDGGPRDLPSQFDPKDTSLNISNAIDSDERAPNTSQFLSYEVVKQ